MRFSYTYKTSDGIRHEDRIEAGSREEAFFLLREKGIRAIKVVSLSGSKANGEEKIVTRKRFVLMALFGGLVAGVAVAVWYAGADFRDSRIVSLERRANGIVEGHRAGLRSLHMDEFRDYRRIADSSGDALLTQKLLLCRDELDMARNDLRDLFREPLADFAEKPGLADEASRLYSSAQDAVDLEEARLDKIDRAFRLLRANRGKWRIAGDSIAIDDPQLEREISNLTREIFAE